MKKVAFNLADKALIIAGTVFLLVFFLRLHFQDSFFLKMIFFCAEAALVGGIADWFAVTALFERPLGFPFHTAILPQRRTEFIAACTKMVQQEFFSKKQLLAKIKCSSWQKQVIHLLTEDKVMYKLKNQLWQSLQKYLEAKDWTLQKQAIKEHILGYVRQLEPLRLWKYLQQAGYDSRILVQLTEMLRPTIENQKTANKIEDVLRKVQAESTSNFFAKFFTGILNVTNVLNLSEAAKLIQKRILAVLTELAEPNSWLHNQILNIVNEKLTEMVQLEEFRSLFSELRERLLVDCGIEESVNRALTTFLCEVCQETSISEYRLIFDRLLTAELVKLAEKLQSDETQSGIFDDLMYNMAARSALQAQESISTVVRMTLDRMTEEQLNRMVRDKVKPDLIWIRVNGSLVGAIIGFVLFNVLALVRIIIS